MNYNDGHHELPTFYHSFVHWISARLEPPHHRHGMGLRWTLSVDNTKGKQVISWLVVRRVWPVLKVFISILFWVIIITIHASHCGVGPTRCLFLMAATLRKVLVHLCVRTWCHATENDLDLAHTHTIHILDAALLKILCAGAHILGASLLKGRLHTYLMLCYWKFMCTCTHTARYATESSLALNA